MSISVDIKKQYGNFSLDVSFEMGNEVLALFGESGCGKSTILKCIAGIVKPDAGRIALEEKVLFDSEKRINLIPQKRNLGYLSQNYALFPNMTVAQNISCGIHGRKDVEKIDSMIRAMHLEGMEKKYPSQLSGGQQQRTALARILIGEPDILMLDEPFSALDTHLRYQMEHEVRAVIRRFGKPVLLVSHDSAEVYRLSDRIAVIKDGHIEKLSDRRDVYLDPSTINGARLTGYRNISLIKHMEDGSIFAQDWGMKLNVADEKGGSVHAAFRTDSARLGPGENTMECVVEAIIPNAFAKAYRMVPKNGTHGAGFVMDIKEAHEELERGSIVSVSIPSPEIVLLRD